MHQGLYHPSCPLDWSLGTFLRDCSLERLDSSLSLNPYLNLMANSNFSCSGLLDQVSVPGSLPGGELSPG